MFITIIYLLLLVLVSFWFIKLLEKGIHISLKEISLIRYILKKKKMYAIVVNSLTNIK